MTIIEPTPEEPTQEPLTLQDQQMARAAGTQLRRLLKVGTSVSVELHIGKEGEEKVEVVALPLSALRPLNAIVESHATGHAVTVVPSHDELTPNQAADALGVSRSLLIKLLDEGKIPFRRDGTQRRIRVDALNFYQKQEEERQLRVLARLQTEAQELGMGY